VKESKTLKVSNAMKNECNIMTAPRDRDVLLKKYYGVRLLYATGIRDAKSGENVKTALNFLGSINGRTLNSLILSLRWELSHRWYIG